MDDKKDKCPVCGSELSKNIHVHSSAEYAGLICDPVGGVYLTACLDCGVVRLPLRYCESIKERSKPVKRRK